jgi:uncharacterized protein (TIGR00369 family)
MDEKLRAKQRVNAPFLLHCEIERTIGAGGVARNRVEVKPHLANSSGAAHGGLLMTMLDSALAGAARSAVEDDHGMMTLDMQVAFLHPGRGVLTGEGRVVRNGRTLIFCEGEVRDADGELVAKATGLFRARRPRAAKV